MRREHRKKCTRHQVHVNWDEHKVPYEMWESESTRPLSLCKLAKVSSKELGFLPSKKRPCSCGFFFILFGKKPLLNIHSPLCTGKCCYSPCHFRVKWTRCGGFPRGDRGLRETHITGTISLESWIIYSPMFILTPLLISNYKLSTSDAHVCPETRLGLEFCSPG